MIGRKAMRAIWTALTFAALAACSSTPTQEQPPASVEDRQPSSTQPGAQAQSVPRSPVAAVDLTAGKTPARSVLTDPASILSKRSIYYDLDKYDVKDEYKALVEAHARYLRDNRNARMLVQGNTDERGSREYNLALGQRRSEGVKKMLILLGATEAQVEAVSLGEEKPRAQGSDEAAWSQNRRSDILYSGEF
jgi:peptidoglycan-associated lipoprotein